MFLSKYIKKLNYLYQQKLKIFFKTDIDLFFILVNNNKKKVMLNILFL